MKKRASTKHLRVKRSRAGLGLFTESPIKKGAHVIEYTGPILSSEKADQKGGKYLFTIDKKHVIDGTTRKNLARYINHSCKPNCYAEVDEKAREVHIYAKRNIEAGEELSYNYGREYFDDHIKPFGCKCPACR